MSPHLFPVELDPVPNHLDYLDLQGEIKDHFNIKLSVAFKFLKKPGHFCSFPHIITAVSSSCPLETNAEVATVTIIHDILLSRLVPLVCQRWFCWDKVKLPNRMLQTGIAALDQNPIASSEHVQPDNFLFPNPSDSLNILHSHQTPDNSITSFTSESFDFTSSWSNIINFSDSTFPTFGSPNFTSTPFPQPPALPLSKGHDLAEASGVTLQHPTHVTQPNDTCYHVHILPGSASSLMIPSCPFILATQPPSAAVEHATRMTEDHILSGGLSPLMPPSQPFVFAKPMSPAVKKVMAQLSSSDAKESRKCHNVGVLTLKNALTNGF
ncbi:hypothetical protein BDR04DRAFT_1118811 [Suillus decipiens]|nr:hypothetical protein BDR04DRAFT_1118811 [Suillus decipiens]